MQVTFVFSGYFYVLTYVVIVESVLISSVHISQKRYWFCFVLSHALNRGFEIFFCCFFLLSSRTPPHFTGGVNHTLYNFIYVQYVINNNNNNNVITDHHNIPGIMHLNQQETIKDRWFLSVITLRIVTLKFPTMSYSLLQGALCL